MHVAPYRYEELTMDASDGIQCLHCCFVTILLVPDTNFNESDLHEVVTPLFTNTTGNHSGNIVPLLSPGQKD
jgi:hypothetical protein